MKYKIFLSDFDGTLVRADGTISEANKRAIAAYRAAGGVFAVCTGRALSSILPRLAELGLKEGLVVAYQGATVADIATGALLKNEGFSREGAVLVVDGLTVDTVKTKPFAEFLRKIGAEGKAMVITENVDSNVVLSARNIPGVTTTTATIISAYEILNNRVLVVDKAALQKIEEVFA